MRVSRPQIIFSAAKTGRGGTVALPRRLGQPSCKQPGFEAGPPGQRL